MASYHCQCKFHRVNLRGFDLFRFPRDTALARFGNAHVAQLTGRVSSCVLRHLRLLLCVLLLLLLRQLGRLVDHERL